MFFVLMEDAPSGRMHVQVTLKKIIYDAFEERCCENPTKAIRPRWGRYALFRSTARAPSSRCRCTRDAGGRRALLGGTGCIRITRSRTIAAVWPTIVQAARD